jgi:hypothetical protein
MRLISARQKLRRSCAPSSQRVRSRPQRDAKWAQAAGSASFTKSRFERLIKAADIVTYARTAVERDFRGDIIDSHAPEMPTRFAKQLAQMVRGGLALGMSRDTALQLALRCARDSIPQVRLEILLELASNPRSRVIDVVRNIAKPYRTIRRELEGLHILGLLHCDEEQSNTDESKTVWRYSLADGFDCATLLTMGGEQGGEQLF